MKEPYIPARWVRRILERAAPASLLLLAGCTVGPNYQRASVPTPPAYKEPPPAGWKDADAARRNLQGKLVGSFWRSAAERSGNPGPDGQPDPAGRRPARARSARQPRSHAFPAVPASLRAAIAERRTRGRHPARAAGQRGYALHRLPAHPARRRQLRSRFVGRHSAFRWNRPERRCKSPSPITRTCCSP